MTEENISAIRARLKFKNLDDFAKGYARYISSGGIFIPMASDRLKPVGALIRFQFLLNDGSTALLGEGRVHQVRSSASIGKAPVGMLVKFTKLSQTSKKLVDLIVVAKKNASAVQEEDASEEEDTHMEETAPAPEQPEEVSGLDAGHSSLEEETRAGPSPHDITPTKHLEPKNQPDLQGDVPRADDAPTRDREGEQEEAASPPPPIPQEIARPVNPFAARPESALSSPSQAPEHDSPPSEDPPTREVVVDDAQQTAPDNDPYAIDLFGDLDLDAPQKEEPHASSEGYDLSLFETQDGEDQAEPAQSSPEDLDEREEEGSPVLIDPAHEEAPEGDAPDEDVSEEEPPEAPVEEVDELDEQDNEQDNPLKMSQEESEVLFHDLFDASLASLGASEDLPVNAPEASPDIEDPDADQDEIIVEEIAEHDDEIVVEEPIEDDLVEGDEAIVDDHVEHDTDDDTDDEDEIVEVAQIAKEERVDEDVLESLPEEEEEEPVDEVFVADVVPSASHARSLNSIKLPPPPMFKTPPSMSDIPGQEDVDLDLIYSDDDDLLGDIMRPGLTASAQPLTIPATSAADPIEAPLEDEELAAVEHQETDDLIDALNLEEELDEGFTPESFTPEALATPAPRQLAQTEGGLHVLAYDDSTAMEHSLEALSIVDGAEDIDLMFDGIFGSSSSGESEDDIFGDMFSTQSLQAVSSSQDGTPLNPEDEEPSKELSNLLDNLESDEDDTLAVNDLDLQGASFAEEDLPSQEEEDESLAALLESARQDIDKIQQHKQEEEDSSDDDLLANLLGDKALEAPEDEVPGAQPIPEPKKREKRGLFSKLFGKDD